MKDEMKATVNCWTCKERKVGCDRALPTCQNCKRTNRACQGYDIKLQWEDKIDKRRKQKKYDAPPPNVQVTKYLRQNGGFHFLNTTFEDLNGSKFDPQTLALLGSLCHENIQPSLSSVPGISDQDGYLLAYYDNVLARMVTTIDDSSNGFRVDLMPMALGSSDAASRSLLQATLALSSFHLGRSDEALHHKVSAIKSLSTSFHDGSSFRLAQLATCMMLCVYSVFDASDTTWQIHLQGARTILNALSDSEREMPSLAFISPWIDYHHVFSGYSHTKLVDSQATVTSFELPLQSLDKQKIVGLLGCSSELLQLIACINQLRAAAEVLPHGLKQPDHTFNTFASQIRKRLDHLKQEVHLELGEKAGTIDHDRITRTAEFYRIGALLYLYQVAPFQSGPGSNVPALVRDAFALLDQMDVCTSPWPLFLVACNISCDEDRIKMLSIIDIMDEKRRIGSTKIIKGLIQALWKQQDLAADDKAPVSIDWRTLIDPESGIPSFI